MRLSLAALGSIAALSFPVSGLSQAADGPATDESESIARYLPQDPASCADDGIAVGGYDVLSYWQEGGPRYGSAGFSVVHDGLTFLFETEQNRADFVAAPERYLPAYNGWCAVTLALGRLSCPDYDNFKIEDDRLLLFELTGFTNGQTLWNSRPTHYRVLADDNYDIVMDFE